MSPAQVHKANNAHLHYIVTQGLVLRNLFELAAEGDTQQGSDGYGRHNPRLGVEGGGQVWPLSY